MEWLRWILLCLGVVLIGAIYWSGRRAGGDRGESLFERARRVRDPGDTAPATEEPALGDTGPELDVAGGRPGEPDVTLDAIDRPAGDEPAADTGPPAPDETRTGPEAAEEAPARAAPAPEKGRHAGRERPERGAQRPPSGGTGAGAAAAEQERLIVLYVVAPKGERLVGARIAEAFASHGLEHGELGVFHASDSDGRTVFSVANVVEPGTFDPATMDTLSTPGLALFMRLPGPQSAATAFERMLDTARALADELEARVLDRDHSTLTRQTEQHLRDDLREFDHRRSRGRS